MGGAYNPALKSMEVVNLIWQKKPKKPIITVDEKLKKLNDDYEKARFTLGVQYMSAVLDADTGTQQEIKEAIGKLKAEFDKQIERIFEEVG